MRIEDVRLKGAENGYILCYTEITKTPVEEGQIYSNNSKHEYKEEVYQDDQVDEAVKRMYKLVKMMRNDGEGMSTMEQPKAGY